MPNQARREHLIALAAFAVLALVTHANQLFGGEVFYTEDVRAVFGPSRSIVGEALGNGEIPFWNPYSFGGAPFLGNPENAIFYPFTWIFVALPLVTGLKVSLVFHTWLAAAFAYACCRSVFRVGALPAFLGGVVFVWSSYYPMHVVHHRDVVAVPWMPLALICLDRALRTTGRRPIAWAAATALVLAVQLFAGNTQTSLYTYALLATYGVVYALPKLRTEPAAIARALGITVVALALGAAVAAIQILPSQTLLDNSYRAGGTEYRFATFLSLPPVQALPNLALPHVFGRWGETWWGRWNCHESILYVGVLPILLWPVVWMARAKLTGARFLTFGAIAALVLAFGKWTPIYRVIYHVVPGFDLFRVPARFTLLFCFAASGLVALGAEAVLRGHVDVDAARKWVRRFVVWTLMPLAILIAAVLAAPDACLGFALWLTRLVKGSAQAAERNEIYEGNLRYILEHTHASFTHDLAWQVASLVVLAASIAVVFYALRGGRRSGIAMTAVLVADLLFFSAAMPFRHTVPNDEVNRPTEVTEHLVAMTTEEAWRIDERESEYLKWNRNIPHRLRAIDGRNLSIYPTVRYAAFVEHVTDDRPQLLDMMRVRYIVADPGEPAPPNTIEIGRDEDVVAYWNRDAFPPAWAASEVRVLDDDEILETVVAEDFDPRVAVVSNRTRLPVGKASVEMTSFSAHEVRYAVRADKPALIVASERMYPGWRAFVDGEETTAHTINWVLRGAVVPEGEHELVFRYVERGFGRGRAVSAVGLAVVLLLMAGGYFSGRGVRNDAT